MSADWMTPEFVLDAARDMFHGQISLDPASSHKANERVKAKEIYTAEEDGLKFEWQAQCLFLNPPYTRGLIDKFVAKFLFDRPCFSEGLILVSADTSTQWAYPLLKELPHVFFKTRLSFIDAATLKPVKGNNRGQAIFYHGPYVETFKYHFGFFGHYFKAADQQECAK